MFKRREIQIKQKREKLMLRHKKLAIPFFTKIFIILFAKEKSNNFLPVDEKNNVFFFNSLKKRLDAEKIQLC